MKTLKMISIKMVAIFSFIILFLTNACAQPGTGKNNKPDTDAKLAYTVETPKMDLQTAVVTGNLEFVRQHIEAGTDINMKDPMSGSTALITAATFGKTAIAKALIDANADPDIQNNEGSTALHAAAFFCRVEIVQMLIDAGADKSIKNNHWATARESVTVAFAEMKPIYETIQKQLAPIGLKLELKVVEMSRPVIAMMLQ